MTRHYLGQIVDGTFYVNGSKHSCSACIHHNFCGQDKTNLIKNTPYRCKHEGKRGLIAVPSNCPIICPKNRVWSVS